MFEGLSAEARRVVSLAQSEAQELGHYYVDSEHILLGLVRDADGPAGPVLRAAGMTAEAYRFELVKLIGRGRRPPGGQLELTRRARSLLEPPARPGASAVGTE